MSAYSRYEDLPLRIYKPDEDGIQYATRRFLPRGEDIRAINDVEVKPHERIDLIAHRNVNNSTLWWKIADANDVMRAEDLEEPGRHLKIPSTYEVNPKLFPGE